MKIVTEKERAKSPESLVIINKPIYYYIPTNNETLKMTLIGCYTDCFPEPVNLFLSLSNPIK